MTDNEIRETALGILERRGKIMALDDFVALLVVRTGESMFIIRRVLEHMKKDGEVTYDCDLQKRHRDENPMIQLLK